MKKVTIDEKRRCPKCGKIENQIRVGYNRSWTQHCKCKHCGIRYTMNHKKIAYSDEKRELALKMYYSGVIGRGVGKVLGMNKANVKEPLRNPKPSRTKFDYICILHDDNNCKGDTALSRQGIVFFVSGAIFCGSAMTLFLTQISIVL